MSTTGWKECIDCGDEFPAERYYLGYHWCLLCGEDRARTERSTWCVSIPYSKGAYQLITDPADLLGMNPKQPRGAL